MKIGVISDTHLSKPTDALFGLEKGVFKDVSMILHAGDLTRISVLDAFSEKKIVAVCGNMDLQEVAEQLSVREIITVAGKRIGLVHGWGSKKGLEQRIIESFDDVDAIVYGHSHEPANYDRNGILMFNPGSFSGGYFSKRKATVGILTVGKEITGEIISLKQQ